MTIKPLRKARKKITFPQEIKSWTPPERISNHNYIVLLILTRNLMSSKNPKTRSSSPRTNY